MNPGPTAAGDAERRGEPARTSGHRRRRGAETQRLVAAAWRGDGWPHVTDAGAGRHGPDLLGTPGVAVEIRARRDIDLVGWLRDAAAGRDGLPVLIVRPDGYGHATVDEWPVVLRHGELRRLLRIAGYGDPLDEHTDDPEQACEHRWPAGLTREAACELGCGLTYIEWSQ